MRPHRKPYYIPVAIGIQARISNTMDVYLCIKPADTQGEMHRFYCKHLPIVTQTSEHRTIPEPGAVNKCKK